MPFLGKTPSQIVDPEVDIDGGTIDGVAIGSVTANAGAFTNLTATGTLTLPDDGISGDDVNGGTISNFASTGIDDNATSTAITISSSQNVGIGTSPSPALGTGLHIRGSGYANLTLQKSASNVGHALEFTDENNAIQYRIGTNFASGGQNLLFAYGATPAIGMMLDSAGKVGIGTSPSNLLHVDKDTGSTPTVYINNSGADATDGAALKVQASGRGSGIADTSIFSVHNISDELFTVRNDGHIGIDNSSPACLLQVGKQTSSTGTNKTVLANFGGYYSATGAFQYQVIGFTGTIPDTSDITLQTGGESSKNFYMGLFTDVGYFNNNRFSIYNSGAERLTIQKSTGNVGIGVTGPAQKLHVNGFALFENNCEIRFKDTGGTQRTSLAMAGNDLKIGTSAGGNLVFVNGSAYTERARITSSGSLLVGRNSKSFLTDGGLDLYTTTVATYGMSIDNAASLANGVQSIVTLKYQNGLANMGCYKHSAVTNPSGYNYFSDSGNVRYFLYHNNGTWRTSTASGHIGTTTGTVVGTQTSDERIKTIESGFEYGLDSVMSLTPIAYSFKNEQERRLGFGAQTTQAIIPEAVYDTGECIDGYDADEDDPMAQTAKSSDTKLAMEYVQLIPVLTKAIQEQQAIIEDLQTRLSALEAN